jgi:hypothetical protein
MRPWLPAVGGILFGAFYATAAVSEAFRAGPECPSDKWLLLPIAGPFIAAGYRGDHARGPCQNEPDAVSATGLFVADGIGQVVGAAFVSAAFLAPKRELVRDPANNPTSSGVEWLLAPAVGPSRAGVSVIGTF